MTLFYDAQDPVMPGQRVPATELQANQQEQRTSSDGLYRFDVGGGRRYRIEVDTSASPYTSPSVLVPPLDGLAFPGPVVLTEYPSDQASERRYYLRFDLPSDDGEIVNNHIAVDPLPTLVSLTKRADRPAAGRGDTVQYALVMHNNSPRELTREAGRPLYILDAPPRGLTYLRGKAIARIRTGDQVEVLRPGADGFQDSFVTATSPRLVRFGPFDLPAGAELELTYQMVVGIDTKPGDYVNRAVAVDGGGVELSAEALTAVQITIDSSIESGVILGRVFCDENGDHRYSRGDRGLMGARVYLDTGSYATTDAHGFYHLSRALPGNRLIKIDTATLAGGQLLSPATRIVAISGGLPARGDFAIRCSYERISFRDAAITKHTSQPQEASAKVEQAGSNPKRVVISGQLEPLSVRIDDRALPLPRAEIELYIPDSLRGPGQRNAQAVPRSGYGAARLIWRPRWSGPAGLTVQRWILDIVRSGDKGALVPVRSLTGLGPLPAEISWDGVDSAGAPAPANEIYAARLTVIGSGQGAEAASPRVAFGIALAGQSGAPKEHIWRDPLFTGTLTAPQATPALRSGVSELVKTLGPADRIEIEVHSDGTGSRLSEIAKTQREADAVVALFTAAGVGQERVTGRGRSSLEPIVQETTAAARQQNRRVVVRVISAPRPARAAPEVLLAEGGSNNATVLINGAPAEFQGQRFTVEISAKPGETIVIDLQDPAGRRAAIAAPAAPVADDAEDAELPSGQQERPPPGPTELSGDFATDTVSIAGSAPISLDGRLFAVDAALAGQPASLLVHPVATTPLGNRRKLNKPLIFTLTIPKGLAVTTWKLVIADENGQIIHDAGGQGVPPSTHTWDGEVTLARSQTGIETLRYGYRLIANTKDGSQAISPQRYLLFAAGGSGELSRSGMLFTERGEPSPELDALLRELVAGASEHPDATYTIELRIAQRPGATVAQQRLSVAVRQAMVQRRLKALNLGNERFTIDAAMSTDPSDRIVIRSKSPQVGKPAAEETVSQVAALAINGITRPLTISATTWRAAIVNASGQELLIDLTKPDGHRAIVRVTLPASQQAGTQGAVDTATSDRLAPTLTTSAGVSRAMETVVELPRVGTRLGSRMLAVRGETNPANRITVMGTKPTEIPVSTTGAFAAIVELAPGQDTLVIQAHDLQGNVATLRRPVSIDERHLFFMAFGEAAAYSMQIEDGWRADARDLDGIKDASSFVLGPVAVHGRMAMYLKGRFSAGPIADSVDVTAHLDTARPATASAFYPEVNDLVNGLPRYDDSTEVRDANALGRLYVHAKTDSAEAVIGSIRTNLKSPRPDALFRYDRTANGAVIEIDKAFSREPHDAGTALSADTHEAAVATSGYRAQGKAFTTSGAGGLVRSSDWFRATGGSLYHLRHVYLFEGSEVVRVVIRDRHSGLVISERLLERGRDYGIDYGGGRIFLSQPLPSEARSDWVLSSYNANTTPLDGNPVFIEARYEHAGTTSVDHGASGVYVRGSTEHLAVGAGLVREDQPERDYSLWGADAALSLGEGSLTTLEVAGSRSRDALTYLSSDGGLSFTQYASLSDDDDAMRLSWRLSQSFALGSLVRGNAPSDATTLSFTMQNVSRGFSSAGGTLDQGRLTASAIMRHRLSEHDTLQIRHDTQLAEIYRLGPSPAELADNGALLQLTDDLLTTRTAAQWSLRRGRWHHRLEGAHDYVQSTATLANGNPAVDAHRAGIGGLSELAYSEQLTVRIGQNATVSSGADPVLNPIASPSDSSRRDGNALAGLTTTAGATWNISEVTSLAADWYQRWNGDSAGQLSFRSALSDSGSMYIRERASLSAGRPATTTVVGAEDRIPGSQSGRTYGELHRERGALGPRDRAVLGLGHRWQLSPQTKLSAGMEHQQTFGGYLPDGTPVGDARRHVLHGSVQYTLPERLKIAAHAELRLDSGDRAAVLAREDGRMGIEPGLFPDHGGVVAGAPTIMQPGSLWQLLTAVGMDWRITPDHTLIGRVRLVYGASDNENAPISAEDEYALTAIGWAYRPMSHDWLNVLARYAYIRDARPYVVADDILHNDSRAHVLAIMPVAELPGRITLSGKLAIKRTFNGVGLSAVEAEPGAGDAADISTTVDVLLWLMRVGYRFYGRWDAGVEVRGLHVARPAAEPSEGRTWEAKTGMLVELSYRLSSFARLGIGYNFSRFSDDELGDLERDSHGLLMRLIGHF